MKKILYGVCGLGNGHTFRQLPIIEHLSRFARIAIFAHDRSRRIYGERFRGNKNITVIGVAIPFYAGSGNGLDFGASARAKMNADKNIFRTNCLALAKASSVLGKADLVISDYEPVSAQFSYAHKIPLVTIDQQSKYLCGDFPGELSGFTYRDEVSRLNMFFPAAELRIACSFFRVPRVKDAEKVRILPPTVKSEIMELKREPQRGKTDILVYISSARPLKQGSAGLARTLAKQKNVNFHIFADKSRYAGIRRHASARIKVYRHGSREFLNILGRCRGIICTAGHSLLAEAMYLSVPVYAIPVAPYEQHMNAYVIDKHKFGLSYPELDGEKLAFFLDNLSCFRDRIREDRKILLRGAGQEKIISLLRGLL